MHPGLQAAPRRSTTKDPNASQRARDRICDPRSCGRGKCSRQNGGPFSKVCGAICPTRRPGSRYRDGDRATMQSSRQEQMAWLLAKESNRPRRVDGRPHHRPGRAVDSARQIHRNDRRRIARSCFDHGAGAPSTGRSNPAPNSASTRMWAPSTGRAAPRSIAPFQSFAASAASPLSRRFADQHHLNAVAARSPATARRRNHRRHYCPVRRQQGPGCRVKVGRAPRRRRPYRHAP